MKTKSFFSLIVFVFLSCIKVAAYTERNFLQHVAAQESLAECLVLNQKWVQYPSYKDREGWSRFLGEYKDEIIKNGESLLGYTWKVVKETIWSLKEVEIGRLWNGLLMTTIKLS